MSTPNPFQPQQPQSPAIGSPPPLAGADPFAALGQTAQAESSLSQQQASMTQGVIGQVQKMQPPEPNRGVLSVAPLLIGLAAIGGKSMGLHAQVMLGAMNGMVSGAMKGDQMAYQDNLKKYQLNQQKMMAVYELQNQYYQEMMNAYKGQADAELKAITLARQLSDDEFNKQYKTSDLALKNQMNEFDRWYKQQSLVDKLKQTDISNQIRELGLQMQMMRLKMTADQQNLDPKGQQVLGHILNTLGYFPAGFGNTTTITRIKALEAASPTATSDQIAQKYLQGMGRGIYMKSQETLLGHREAASSAALNTLTEPGGTLDLLIQSAQKIGFTDDKLVNTGRLQIQQRIKANPELQAYRMYIQEARTEYAQAISRGGQVTNESRDEANSVFPDNMSLSEMRKLYVTAPLAASAALRGTQAAAQQAITNGPGAGGEAPSASTMQFNSLKDLQAAYKAGKISYDDATAYAKQQGWVQ
jgi:hypothetical protein